jgi:hypothetical protein
MKWHLARDGRRRLPRATGAAHRGVYSPPCTSRSAPTMRASS